MRGAWRVLLRHESEQPTTGALILPQCCNKARAIGSGHVTASVALSASSNRGRRVAGPSSYGLGDVSIHARQFEGNTSRERERRPLSSDEAQSFVERLAWCRGHELERAKTGG